MSSKNTTASTTSPLPIPIRKKLQKLLELKVGIKAMEEECARLQAEVLASKYAPQTYGDPALGSISQKQNKQYKVDIAIVTEVIGQERALKIASISKTALEENVSKQELTRLDEKHAIITTTGAVSYTYKAPPKKKGAQE